MDKDDVKHLAYSLAEFTTFVIDKYDTDHPSSRNQIFAKTVFAGASCGSLVEYAKTQRSKAFSFLTEDEVERIKTRSNDGSTTKYCGDIVMSKVVFEIDEMGNMHGLYTDEVDLFSIGRVTDMRKASNVEFNEEEQVWEVVSLDGEVLYKNPNREVAIDFEIETFSPGGKHYAQGTLSSNP